ncbi:MAG TPA: hypothetical protein DIW15_04560 [Bavariicoccus seileri]|uniref:Uncharacterized protein n=1 Tax=Bavariicoccus seileri TaxID=549685 RepID=A0A3D4S663_9ENTE|nr:hypothetical protein [Bavariicoccus seileri]HCS93962.1 hypothetical protein [Bavariicoccus seileri]
MFYFIEEFFKIPMIRKSPLSATLSGIGSGLGQFTLVDNNLPLKVGEIIFGKLYPNVHVWGTGFIENKDWMPFYRRNMEFHAVRGLLTKAKVEKILGHPINAKLGDG